MQDMGNITAIILCGGLGTRLRSISGDLPKPMVEVAGRPFMEYILDYLIDQGVNNAILAVSYRKEAIFNHFGNTYRSLSLKYSNESIPLGTGGAVKFALEQCSTSKEHIVLVINGDTFVEYSLPDMVSHLSTKQADFVMALSCMEDTSRYGRVNISVDRITEFEEKKAGQSGYINAGVYLFRSTLRHVFPSSPSFSFENEVLKKLIHTHSVLPSLCNGYFIDIGIPCDFYKAQKEFVNRN